MFLTMLIENKIVFKNRNARVNNIQRDENTATK